MAMTVSELKKETRREFLASYNRSHNADLALKAIDLRKYNSRCSGNFMLNASVKYDDNGLNVIISRTTHIIDKKTKKEKDVKVILLVIPVYEKVA